MPTIRSRPLVSEPSNPRLTIDQLLREDVAEYVRNRKEGQNRDV